MQTLAQLNSLYHCVEVVQHASFGLEPADDLRHVAALLIFLGVASWMSFRRSRRQLID